MESFNLDQYSNTEHRSSVSPHEAQAGLSSREAGWPDLQCTCGLDPKQTSPSFHQTAGLPSHLQVFHVDIPTDPSFRNPAVPPNFKFAWCIYSSCPVHPLGGILPYSPPSVPSGVPPPLQPIGQELYQPAGPASLAFQPVGSFLIQYNGQRDFKQVGLLGHQEAGPLSNLEKAGSPFVKETSENSTHEADQSCEDNSDTRGRINDVVFARSEPRRVWQSAIQSNGPNGSSPFSGLQSYGPSEYPLDWQQGSRLAGFSALQQVPYYQPNLGRNVSAGTEMSSLSGGQHNRTTNDPRANSSQEGNLAFLDDSVVSRSVSVEDKKPYYTYLEFGKYNLPTHFGTSIDEKLKLGVRVTSDYELRIIAREIKDSIKNITVKPSPNCLKQVVIHLMETYKSSLVDDSSRYTKDALVKILVRLFAQERKKIGCKLPAGRPRVTYTSTKQSFLSISQS